MRPCRVCPPPHPLGKTLSLSLSLIINVIAILKILSLTLFLSLLHSEEDDVAGHRLWHILEVDIRIDRQKKRVEGEWGM